MAVKLSILSRIRAWLSAWRRRSEEIDDRLEHARRWRR